MRFEIKNRWNGSMIFECDADSLKLAVELAISKRISLRDSDLSGSDLSGSNLRGSDLRGSNLRGSNLRGSDLRGSDLRVSDLRGSDLSGLNLRDSDLRGSDLSGSNLSGSNLSGSNLRGSNLRGSDLRVSDLRVSETDFYSILQEAKTEVVGLYKALLDGRINGSQYSGECACLVGTIANVRGVSVSTLTQDSLRPAERLFLAIRQGDTPESNPVSAIVKDWIEEFAKANEILLPKRKVAWE
jgi:uncharacterized protein YjbI with pentapeptide repeats